MEQWWIVAGLMVPFAGTAAGAAMVFLMKNRIGDGVEKFLTGLAAGVMLAASVWSLLLPSLAMSEDQPAAFLPAVSGFLAGVLFLMLTDRLMPHWLLKYSGRKHTLCTKKNGMMIFAVTLHNIPEGMAVGVSFAGALKAGSGAAFAAAFALALGIAIQNFPEGAIISMPLAAEGYSKPKAFLYGVLSGVVEPLAAALTLLLTALAVKVLPLLLAFAAGAMIYVCVNELIPYSRSEKSINIGVIGFGVGFLVMMVLDVMFS